MRVASRIPKVGSRDEGVKLVKKLWELKHWITYRKHFNFMQRFTLNRRKLTFKCYIRYKTINSQSV